MAISLREQKLMTLARDETRIASAITNLGCLESLVFYGSGSPKPEVSKLLNDMRATIHHEFALVRDGVVDDD